MRKTHVFWLMVLGWAFLASSTGWAEDYAGTYIVRFKPSITKFSALPQYGHLQRIHHFENLWFGFSAQLTNQDLQELRSDPRVENVFPDQPLFLDASQVNVDWGLSRIDQRFSYPDRRYDYSHLGQGITVYVIDTGINKAHKDFAGRAQIAHSVVPVDDKDGGDCHGHGTHVAGIIGGARFGVAKEVKLVGLRALDCEGRGSLGNILQAMDWLAKNAKGRSVVNISIGTTASKELDEAIATLTEKGLLFVVSAGNSAQDACLQSPARAPKAIAVGALDPGDVRAPYSNEGPCVDIFAPGTEILSAHKGGVNSSKVLSGTSMAAPFVSGTVALMLEQFPKASVEEIRKMLYRNATQGMVSNTNTPSNHVVHTFIF